ncbi:IbrB-like domain-containing protein [Streptobacillus moniliformis]|uniref:IbrB-like domain-containing protein n=1 Tax=Streptobacillus moniliformis TaxID=34105 RepID=UPI0007E3A4C2|nr:ParB/RepB/Spo0J family partition protein [Streptobacillus moniliformis]
MKKIKFPVLNVKMIPMNKIIVNDYNPNKVATPEMKLLKLSIEEDGYTMPIVVYHDKENDNYIIVDGFHRYKCAKEYFNLKEIPATIIEKSLSDRMASTIRHNRARGTHQIRSMSDIVLDLFKSGWSDSEICNKLGMDLDEVIRLKQITGLKEAFANYEFSKSWIEFEEKIKNEIKEVDE